MFAYQVGIIKIWQTRSSGTKSRGPRAERSKQRATLLQSTSLVGAQTRPPHTVLRTVFCTHFSLHSPPQTVLRRPVHTEPTRRPTRPTTDQAGLAAGAR